MHVLSIINNLLESFSSDLFCNFCQVTRVELEEVLSQGAYMLLYCRYVCVGVNAQSLFLSFFFVLFLFFILHFFFFFYCLVA